MLQYPPRPSLPPTQIATAPVHVRYEDVCQDGRVAVLGMPIAIGASVWRVLLSNHPAGTAAMKLGVVAILSRLILEGTEETVGIGRPLQAEGAYQLAHAVDAAGAVDRIFLNMWVDLSGVRARMVGPPPPGAGEMAPVGRVFAEHTFTRLFAPPGQRKVVQLGVPGLPDVPEARHAWQPAETAMALPAGAVPIDEPSADEVPIAFGLDHTDSNQHVNSLEYPHMFIDAALRRFSRLGKSTRVLARSADIAYRKPCFAGDRVRIALQAFELDGRLGAAGGFVTEADAASPAALRAARPNCYISMLFH